MIPPQYNYEQERLARKIREVIAEFDKEKIGRDEIAVVLSWESVQVEQGSKENLTWLEGLGARKD